jgi:hypothetical protein
MYDEEDQIARDPLSSWVRGDVHELRKSQYICIRILSCRITVDSKYTFDNKRVCRYSRVPNKRLTLKGSIWLHQAPSGSIRLHQAPSPYWGTNSGSITWQIDRLGQIDYLSKLISYANFWNPILTKGGRIYPFL